MQTSIVEIASAFMVLFAVIDISGSIPIILDLKKKTTIKPAQASLVAYFILIVFLFLGEKMLAIFGVDISSFAVAGSFVLFLMGLEMVLGIQIFKHDDNPMGGSIVPLAFPLIAGAGSFTSILSLRAEYSLLTVIIALTLNIGVVYMVLRLTNFFERVLGKGGTYILQKFFGIILLAIAIKLFSSNAGNLFN